MFDIKYTNIVKKNPTSNTTEIDAKKAPTKSPLEMNKRNRKNAMEAPIKA